MRIRYFVVDEEFQLRKASQALVEGLWSDQRDVCEAPFDVGSEFRILTAVCDDELRPLGIYMMRLDLERGRISSASRRLAQQAVSAGAYTLTKSEPNTFALAFQVTGWPEDWRTQLAVALDTPVTEIVRVGIGGPLPISDLAGISVRASLRYFEDWMRE